MTAHKPTPSVAGLLCGAGELPRHVAASLRGRGCTVVAVGIKGEADPAMEEVVDQLHWTGIARLGRWLKVFKEAEVDVLLMVGGIRKQRMFSSKAAMLPDWRSIKLWYGQTASKQDHTILEAVADEFEKEGIPVGSVADYCPELLAPEGTLTPEEPTPAQWRDIRFAWPIAKQVAALQIGQCIVVKDQAVVAVEGMDGTDPTLRRGGKLAGGGAVAVKVAREGHDERFDIPSVGPGTADTMAQSGVKVLAVEAGRTLVLQREELGQRAAGTGVSIVGVSEPALEGNNP